MTSPPKRAVSVRKRKALPRYASELVGSQLDRLAARYLNGTRDPRVVRLHLLSICTHGRYCKPNLTPSLINVYLLQREKDWFLKLKMSIQAELSTQSKVVFSPRGESRVFGCLLLLSLLSMHACCVGNLIGRLESDIQKLTRMLHRQVGAMRQQILRLEARESRNRTICDRYALR